LGEKYFYYIEKLVVPNLWPSVYNYAIKKHCKHRTIHILDVNVQPEKCKDAKENITQTTKKDQVFFQR
jgi:hypothetical protein